MRIAYLCNAKSQHFIRWYEYFLRRGHTISVISGDTRLNNQAVTLPAGIDVFHLPERRHRDGRISFMMNLLRLPLIVRALKRHLEVLRPDIVHAHSIRYGYWGAVAGFRPLIVTPYGSDAIVHTRQYWLYRRIAKYVYERSDLITQDSLECLKASLELGIAESRNHLIQNGVDLTKFHESVSGEAVRRRLGLAGRTVVLHARELLPVYNVDTLLEAFRRFHEQVPDAVLLLLYVFTGTPDERRLRRRADDLGIGSSAMFHGPVDHSEMPAYQAAADMVVSVPSSDSMPSTISEAMAVGRPVVLSSLPWTEFLMRDEVNCLLVDGASSEAISGAMLRLYRSPDLRAKLVSGGRLTVREHLDYYKNMASMERLMEQAMSDSRASRPIGLDAGPSNGRKVLDRPGGSVAG